MKIIVSIKALLFLAANPASLLSQPPLVPSFRHEAMACWWVSGGLWAWWEEPFIPVFPDTTPSSPLPPDGIC